MANRDNPSGFVAEMNLAGGPITVWEGRIASNSTCTAGDSLKAASGYASISGDVSNILGVAIETITASATATQTIEFVPAVDWMVFSGQCSGAPTQAKVFTSCEIEATATGTYEIDEDATTLDAIRLIGFEKNTSIGTNARMLFIWNKSDFASYGRATS
jgi:hypothetical protein